MYHLCAPINELPTPFSNYVHMNQYVYKALFRVALAPTHIASTTNKKACFINCHCTMLVLSLSIIVLI